MKLFQTIHQLDVKAFLWCMRRKRVKLWAQIGRSISRTADGYLYPVIALCMLLLADNNGRTICLAIIVGLVIERAAYFVLKNLLKRHRPADALPEFESAITPADKFSLPSGHTSAAFLVTAVLTHFFPPLMWWLYPWACLVGASRVFLGVHFPADILAGAIMGSTIAFLTLSWLLPT